MALPTRLLPLALLLVLPPRPAGGQPVAASVPYVPTPMPVVSAMLELGRVGPGDVVYDLGSGDGRIVITAARRHGARGVGVELDPRLVERSRANAAAAGVGERVRFEERDLFQADLREASVVMLYLSPLTNLQLRPKLLRELPPGARVVSHTFHMEEWAPDSVVHVGEGFGRATIHLWTVPADVDGFWQLRLQTPRGERSLVLELRQRFQALAGAARGGTAEIPVEAGRMAGERISLRLREPTGDGSVRHWRLEGRLDGGVLEGSYSQPGSPTPLPWRATRFRSLAPPSP